jgi:hypothetical protein
MNVIELVSPRAKSEPLPRERSAQSLVSHGTYLKNDDRVYSASWLRTWVY